jgi:hypothetical protein
MENLKELKEKSSMWETQAQNVQKQVDEIYQAIEKKKFIKNKGIFVGQFLFHL